MVSRGISPPPPPGALGDHPVPHGDIDAPRVAPQLGACAGGVIGKLRFNKPAGGGIVKVSYPFVFRPGS